MSSGPDPAGDLARLYREAIRRHSKDPIGYRQPLEATHRHEEYNAQCGDRVEIRLHVSDDLIESAVFDGEACAICMASASLLCSLAPGRPVAELRDLSAGLEMALKKPAGTAIAGAAPAAKDVGERNTQSRPKPLLHPSLQPLLGVRPYPSRVRCATLPWTAAQRALAP